MIKRQSCDDEWFLEKAKEPHAPVRAGASEAMCLVTSTLLPSHKPCNTVTAA